MDADYLKSTLGDLLSEGLSATVLTNPRDKIGYLGEWLLQHVEEKRLAKERTQAKARELRKDEEEHNKAIEEDEKQRAADLSEQETAAEREKQFIAVIEKGESMETLLPTFLSLLRDATGATSAYFGEVETNKETEESSLKYLAATAENEWLLEKRLESKRGKNTFSLFAPEEEEPEEEDEDGNPIPRPPKQLRSVFVPNVLLGPKSQHMFFFKKPQLGSYTAVRLQFPQSVSDEVLDEAAEREEEIMAMKKEQDEAREQAEREAREEAAREAGEELNEDDEDEDDEDEDEDDDDEDRSARRRKKKSASDDENIDETDEEREARLKREDDARQVEEEEFLLSQLQRQPIQYALCLDTLGQNRRFSDEQLAAITRFATLLQTKLQSLDRAGFTVARRQRAALLEFNREVAELNDQGTLKTDDEKAEELERASDELEALGRPMTEEDVVYKYRTDLILGSLKAQIADWAQCEVFRGSLAVLQGVLFLLGYPQSSVVNSIGQPEWRRIRKVLLNSEEFFARFKDYDPRATHFEQVKANAPEKLYTESVSVGKVVEPIEYDEVKVRNYALSELLLWVREALAVKRRAKLERAKDARRKQRAAEAAAEAARLEAEAAAEAAERAANGEEDEGEDGEEEEEDE